MGTIIFDFDSTLVNCESLEVILADTLATRPDDQAKIAALTDAGMSGEISFAESLQQRLAIAQPTLAGIAQFTQNPQAYLTSGATDFVEAAHHAGWSVWIISGGLETVIRPYGDYLNIPPERIHAVKSTFNDAGQFVEIDQADAFSTSKLAGARAIADAFEAPSILVGDGYTDYQLFEAGLVNDFILYTEHAAREPLVHQITRQANSISALRTLLAI